MKTKEEAREYVHETVESQVVADMLRDYMRKIVKVHGFLLTIVLSKRMKRKLRAIRTLQGFLRVCLAKKRANKLQVG